MTPSTPEPSEEYAQCDPIDDRPDRPPPSSSALVALSSLTPPSPILCPSQLTTTFTSGDIPIFFDFIAATPSLSLTTHIFCDLDERCSTGPNILQPSCSTNTLDTVGTFGPIQKSSRYYDSAPTSPTLLRRSSTLARSFINEDLDEIDASFDALPLVLPPADYFAAQSYSKPGWRSTNVLCATPNDHTSGSNQQSLGRTTVPNQLGGRVQNDAASIESDSANLSDTLYGQSLANVTLSQSPINVNTLPTDYFSVAQLSESCPSSPQHRNHSKLPNSASRDTFVDAYTRQLAVAATLATLESARRESAPSSPQVAQSPHGGLRHKITDVINQPQPPLRFTKPQLPRFLDWLRDSVVDILIDQEGFRSVHARFKFSGYSLPSQAPTLLDQTLDNHEGIVQFRPITRQVFYFHYAPFDGLPVLRRITVSGEESRDYISRQASLGLKSNGVYTVRGREVSSLPATYEEELRIYRGPEPVKFKWRFDYLVDDRYDASNISGKKFDNGEKVLTPLTFSCSPLLLHPLQGKRIRLMHIVKKSVATKLIAEKMEPPTLRAATRSSWLTNLPAQPVPAQPPMKSHIWNMHRRAKSHAPRQELVQRKLADIQNQQLLSTTLWGATVRQHPKKKPEVDASPIRRRRASSAGERSRPVDGAHPSRPPQGSPICHPAKHIIPRSHLARLLDANIESAVRATPIQVELPEFQPLTPSPRHHQGRTKAGVIVAK